MRPSVLPSARALAAVLAAVLTTLLAGAITAAPASAHAEFESSEPVSGARLSESPERFRLDFTERVRVVDGGVRLLDGRGAPVATGPVTADGRTVTVVLDTPLRDDGYVLAWRVLSADSHPISGSIPFTVGEAKPAGAVVPETGSSTGTGIALAVSRWVGYAGLTLLAGPLLLVLLCWPGGRSDPRTSRLVVTGAAAALVGTAGGLLAQGPYVVGTSLTRAGDPDLLTETLRSPYGQAAVVRVVAVLALLLLLDAVRRRRSAAGLVGSGLALTAVLATYPAQGHAAGADDVLIATVVDAVHLAAMATWVGGLALLGYGLLRGGSTDLAQVLPRWSRLALGAVAVLVTTGVLQSVREVGSLAALSTSTYGRLLVAKLLLFVGLLVLGDLGRRWVRRTYGMRVVHAYSEGDEVQGGGTDVRALRRSVVGEAAIAAVVLAVTAVLVATTPGRVSADDDRRSAQQQAEDTIGLPDGTDVLVAVRAGRTVTVRLRTPDGRPFDPASTTASAAAPGRGVDELPLTLTRRAPGTFRAAEPLPYDGEWRITVRVQTSPTRAGVGTAVVEVR